jgi:hypothetical protein
MPLSEVAGVKKVPGKWTYDRDFSHLLKNSGEHLLLTGSEVHAHFDVVGWQLLCFVR